MQPRRDREAAFSAKPGTIRRDGLRFVEAGLPENLRVQLVQVLAASYTDLPEMEPHHLRLDS